MKFAHVINPVKVKPDSDLYVAQPVTFESIRVAKDFAGNKVQVNLFTVCYNEDQETIPSFFTRLPLLNRSINDVVKFEAVKKLPLIHDILHSLYNGTDADYLIFTNMDIALMPQFYAAVAEIVNSEKCDALLVTRRGISVKYKSVSQLPLMYSDFGKPHPGFDCFVFKRELLNKLILEHVCVGVPFLEVTMVHNLIAFAEKLKLVDDMHLTFHIGAEVMPPVNGDLYQHNRNEYEQKIYPKLKPHLTIGKFPYAALPFYKRMIKWMLNPVFRTHQVSELEGKNWGRKLKYKLNELRFKVFDY